VERLLDHQRPDETLAAKNQFDSQGNHQKEKQPCDQTRRSASTKKKGGRLVVKKEKRS